MLNALYYSNEVSIPVAFEIVEKPIQFSDLKTQQVKRKSDITKNELMRDMIQTALNNQLKFKYVLMDTWFGAKENFEFIVKKDKEFMAALKSNRLFATSLENKYAGKFNSMETRFQQSMKNDGKLKSIISHSNIMLIWLNHQQRQLEHKVIISFYQYWHFLNLSV